MTVKEVFEGVRQLGSMIKEEIVPEQRFNGDGTRQFFIWFLFAAALVAGWYGYTNYQVKKNEAAFGFLADYIEEYERKQEGEKVDWTEVEQSFNLEYGNHIKSNAAPFLLIFKAEHLLRQGNRADALPVLDEVVEKLPKESPFTSLYIIKRALVQVDSGDAALKEKALETLRTLADDADNKYADNAAYHLGRYYWAHDDMAQAKTVWQKLVASQEKASTESAVAQSSSPWAARAKIYLEQIA